MIIINLGVFVVFFLLLIKCTDFSIKYSSNIARTFHFPEFMVSFLIVALISVLPEATISVISAIKGQPELGLGTLLGSNIADLTLVLGVVTLFSSKNIKVKSKILKNNFFYLVLLLLPLVLGFDGRFSRLDGSILLLVGIVFFAKIYLESNKLHKKTNKKIKHKKESFFKNFLFLIISLGVLLFIAYFTVKFAINFANDVKLPIVLIGVTILALGTCLPELIFSIIAVRKNHDDLALGDILGTVITDTTIVLGIVALITPFSFNPYNIYVTATTMFLAGFFVIMFMKSDKSISKFEGLLLIFLYILFILLQFFVSNLISFS